MTFKEQLETERFVLNIQQEEDINELFRLRSDPRVLKYLGRDPMKTLEEAKLYIKERKEDFAKGNSVDYAIRWKNKPELIGKAGFWHIQKERNRMELGYSLLPEYHRQGIMYECVQALLDYAFDELGFHSIAAEIDPFNMASESLLKKCKFRKEAHFTEDYLYNGEYSDSAIYSLLQRWR